MVTICLSVYNHETMNSLTLVCIFTYVPEFGTKKMPCWMDSVNFYRSLALINLTCSLWIWKVSDNSFPFTRALDFRKYSFRFSHHMRKPWDFFQGASASPNTCSLCPPSPPPPKPAQGHLGEDIGRRPGTASWSLEAEGQTVVRLCMTKFPVEFNLGNI